ncbi:MAG: hypothetical protein NTX59_06310 [Elusimicrobia bacterium]|nr:hypothetical protein [Elusimicrobiota bacterium]
MMFSENFIDNKVFVKKSRKARKNQDLPESARLENQLWLFLYNIGFRKLNCDGECTISWGKDNERLKRVDVIAENDEVLIMGGR